jgi:ABC-type dipeptide/oligopeptide/nickel transport system permease subunit
LFRTAYLSAFILWVGTHLFIFMLFGSPTVDATLQLQAASSRYLLGTDFLGRDILLMTISAGIYSISMSIFIGIATLMTSLVVAIGAELNQILGVFVQIVSQMMLAIPIIVFALFLQTLLPKSNLSLIFVLVLAQLAPTVVVLRPSIRQSLYSDYVMHAQGLGANVKHIVWVHIRRDIIPLSRAYMVLLIAYTLFYISAIGFLGLLPDPSHVDLGKLMSEGRKVFRVAPLASIAPAVSIIITLYLLNRIGGKSTTHQIR